MSEEKYSILSLTALEDIENMSSVLRWKKRLHPKIYEYYLLKKLPIKQEEVFYLNEPGLRIFLPFTKEDIKEKQDLVKRFTNKLAQKLVCNYLFAEKGLREYIELPYIGCSWLLNYILFPEILEKIVKTYQIDCKNMKLVLMDSSDSRMEYLLELLLPHLNYLTIITDRPEFFDHFIEYAFHNTGLVVEVITKPITDTLSGDFIIYLGVSEENSGADKLYYKFEKNAVVLLLDTEKLSAEHIHSRRKDLKIIYDYYITIQDERINKELVSEILCGLNWRVKAFAEHKGHIHYINEVEEIKKRYKIELKYINSL